MFYLATNKGFLRTEPAICFTSNVRLATPFSTFDEADTAGKALGTHVRYCAVLRTA